MFSQAEEVAGKRNRTIQVPQTITGVPSPSAYQRGRESFPFWNRLIWLCHSWGLCRIKTFGQVADRFKVKPPATSMSQNMVPSLRDRAVIMMAPALDSPRVLCLWLSPSKQSANVLWMSRQCGIESVYLQPSTKAAELESCQDSKLPAARPGKGTTRLLSLVPPHQFLDILWHLNRLLLLRGRMTRTVTLVLMSSWWLPSDYHTVTWRWNYSRKCKVCVTKTTDSPGLGDVTYSPALDAIPCVWGTGQVWQDCPGRRGPPC